jgi:signal transduction histidine kinase
MVQTLIYIRVCALTLLGLQQSLLVFRFFTCYNKKELAAFALVLAYLGFKLIFPDIAYLNEVSTFLVIWALGGYLSILLEDKKRGLWNVAVFSIVGVCVLLMLMGLKHRNLFAYFYVFTAGILFIYPMGLFFRYYKSTQNKLILYFCVMALGALVAGGYEYLSAVYTLPVFDISIWFVIFILLGTGYLLSQQGYLLSTEFHSLYSRLSMQERKLRQLSSKLIYTEQTLVVKDRFMSIGLLAAGIIHEFKNILGLILSCAQYGQTEKDQEPMRQSFSLIEEHTRHGLKTVVGLLEKIKDRDELLPESFSINQFCQQVMKVVRANYRGAGVHVGYVVHKDFSIAVRKADLEQAILNIIRNAAQALESLPAHIEKTINIEVGTEYTKGMLSITDNAGGLPQEIACNIFEPHFRSSGSTGIGLYLTRMLAEQSGIQLVYAPIKNGSRFTFIFPEIG